MSLLSLPLTLDDDIFGHIRNISDLISLSWTSKDAYFRIRAFMSRVFRIRRLLSQFFNPQELNTFQEFQRRSGLVISGQALLFFLMRCEQESNQLDLFLHLQYKDMFCEWINSTRYVAKEHPLGLSVTEQVAILDYAWDSRPDELQVWSCLMDARGFDSVEIAVMLKGTSKTILVHLCRGAPVQMILDLPTTCLMNIATHSRIYSLYPKATFQRGISLLRPHWRSMVNSFADLEPYLHLGIRFTDSCWNMYLPLFPFGRRSVGDKLTCVLNNMGPENEDSDVGYRLLTNSWLVYYLPKGAMDIHGMTIASARLQDVYIVSDEPLRKSVVKLMDRLHSQSSNMPLPDFLDKQLHQGILDETMVSQDSQLRLTYE